jgi:hypothetical protein
VKTLWYRTDDAQPWKIAPDHSPSELAISLAKLSKDVGYTVQIKDENGSISHWYVESDVNFIERLDGDPEDW